MNEWICDYLYLAATTAPPIVLKTSQHTHILTKGLKISEKWGILNPETVGFLSPASNPPPLRPRNSQDLTLRNIFRLLKCLAPGSVLVTNLDWSPPTMGLSLVVSLTLANRMCFMHRVSWPSEKRSGPRLLFPLGFTETEKLVYVATAMSSGTREAVCPVIKMIGVVGRKSKIQNCLCESQCSVHPSWTGVKPICRFYFLKSYFYQYNFEVSSCT